MNHDDTKPESTPLVRVRCALAVGASNWFYEDSLNHFDISDERVFLLLIKGSIELSQPRLTLVGSWLAEEV